MIAQDPIALQSFGTAREDSERKSSAAPSFVSANEERPLDLQDERDQAPPDGGRQAWTTVACCSVITFLFAGISYSWGVIQTNLVASKISSTATLSFIGAIAIGSVSIFALLNALTLRKFGARATCLGGIIFLAAGQFISSFALKNVGGLFVSAGVITGFGTSLCFMAVATLPAQYFVLRRGLANGVAYAGGGLGGACFSIVLGKLLNKLGVAWSFRALGFVTLLLGLPAAAFIKERPVRRSMSFVEWQLFKDGKFILLALAGAIGTFPLLVPPFFIPMYAETLGLPRFTGALLLAGWNLSSAVGRLGFGFFGDRLGPVNSLLLSFALNAMSMLAIWPVSTSLGPLAVFVVVNGLANGAFFSIMPTVVGAVFGPFRVAVAMGMIVTSWAGGYIMGAPIAGYILDGSGGAEKGLSAFRPAMFYAGGVAMISVVLVAAMRTMMTRKFWVRV